MNIYLIKRGPRPDYHKAPYHPVIVTPNLKVAKWEAGPSRDGAWVWSNHFKLSDTVIYSGWLLNRWNGLDIDYGHIVSGITLPDGTEGAFHHPTARSDTWALLQGAIWWSTRPIPRQLTERGVIPAPDEFSRGRIEDDERRAREGL